ncbi:amidohydrolase family protein [Candidatus Albibeggiatoa sp. nov. NOAA]|uniref:amidohydrolase family protein n=1 Tax=Candidatus Albibeggiatoa sp. nov. NOAA TaxID=3162724 RepID=UPI0032F59F55|nr:amidohydrolase family protein [Thiotrichaceae bacterium]
MSDFILKGGFLYAGDEQNTVMPDSWVWVENGIIKQIGDAAQPLPQGITVRDISNQMILPGFVNPHWHESFVAPDFEDPTDKHVTKTPYAGGGNVEALGSMFGFISTVGERLTPEEGVAIAKWSMWTQLRSGSTALGDIGSANTADAMAQAALELGIRVRVSRWGSDIMLKSATQSFEYIADTQAQIRDWEDLMQKWDNHASGLIGGMPSVTGAFGSSDEQLQALGEIAKRYDAPYATHLSPLKNEATVHKAIFGMTSIERFEKLGLLTPRLLAVHTAYATDEEYQKLVSNQVKICHSPAHYGILGESTVSETGMIGRLIQDGYPISTSTDGDVTYVGGMPEALRATHLGHNEALNDNTVCPPTTALRTGTLYGAKALAWSEKLGSIEVGKQADFVLVNIDDWRYQPCKHPLRTFLLSGSSADVHTVIIAGKTLIENGKSTTHDEAKMYQDYLDAATAARQRIAP